MTFYQETITRILKESNIEYDPRHIESWIRIEHPTLDGLGYNRFRNEIFIAVECIDETGQEASEQLAVSMGF